VSDEDAVELAYGSDVAELLPTPETQAVEVAYGFAVAEIDPTGEE